MDPGGGIEPDDGWGRVGDTGVSAMIAGLVSAYSAPLLVVEVVVGGYDSY